MKAFLDQHGTVATILAVLAMFNIILTAVKSFIEKLEDFLAPGSQPDPNSNLEKVKAVVSKVLGWSSSVIDWLTGNKEH